MKLKTIFILSLIGGLIGSIIGASDSELDVLRSGACGFFCPFFVLLLLKILTLCIRKFCNKVQIFLGAVFLPAIFIIFVYGAWIENYSREYKVNHTKFLLPLSLCLVLVFIFEFMLFSPSELKSPKLKKNQKNKRFDSQSSEQKKGEKVDRNAKFLFGDQKLKQGEAIEFSDSELEEMSLRSPADAALVENWLKPKSANGNGKKIPGSSPSSERSCAGSSGCSIEDAVIVDASSSITGTFVEHGYIQKQCGQKDVDWRLEMQTLLEGPDGKHYDRLTVRLKNGVSKDFYFDISSFYGRRK